MRKINSNNKESKIVQRPLNIVTLPISLTEEIGKKRNTIDKYDEYLNFHKKNKKDYSNIIYIKNSLNNKNTMFSL